MVKIEEPSNLINIQHNVYNKALFDTFQDNITLNRGQINPNVFFFVFFLMFCIGFNDILTVAILVFIYLIISICFRKKKLFRHKIVIMILLFVFSLIGSLLFNGQNIFGTCYIDSKTRIRLEIKE